MEFSDGDFAYISVKATADGAYSISASGTIPREKAPAIALALIGEWERIFSAPASCDAGGSAKNARIVLLNP